MNKPVSFSQEDDYIHHNNNKRKRVQPFKFSCILLNIPVNHTRAARCLLKRPRRKQAQRGAHTSLYEPTAEA